MPRRSKPSDIPEVIDPYDDPDYPEEEEDFTPYPEEHTTVDASLLEKFEAEVRPQREPVRRVSPLLPEAPTAILEEEEDISEEPTNLVAQPLEEAPTQIVGDLGGDLPTLKLVVLNGDMAGKELWLEREVMTLGRGAENDIIFPEISVSRQHARLLTQGNYLKVIDLKSGNGTFLNRNRIKEAVLSPGDTVSFGRCNMRFEVIPPAGMALVTPPQPRREPAHVVPDPRPPRGQPSRPTRPGFFAFLDTPLKKAFVLGAAGLASVVLTLGIVKRVVLNKRTVQTTVSDAVQQSADNFWSLGMEAFREKRWEEAKENLAMVSQFLPEYPGLVDHLAAVELELRNRALLDRGARMFQEGRHQEGMDLLGQVVQTSYSDTYVQAQALIASRRVAVPPAAPTEVAMAAPPPPAPPEAPPVVVAPTEAPPVVAAPTEAPPVELPAIRVEEEPVAPVKVQEPPKAKREPAVKAKKPERPKAPDKPKVAAAEPSGGARGLSLYKGGRFGDAARAWEAAGGKERQLAGLARDFESNLKEGEAYYKQKDPNRAIRSLRKAQSLDRKISGGHYGSRVGTKLADMYYSIALQEYQGQKYVQSAKNVQRALGFNRGHSLSQKLMNDLEGQAKRMYTEGFMAKQAGNIEQAKRLWKQVLQILPKSNKVHQQAQTRLQSLEGG